MLTHYRRGGWRKKIKRITYTDFINRARQIYGDKYDYSKVHFVNTSTKVCIICPQHGEFWIDISIITNGNGLPGCIIITEEIRKKKFKEIAEEEARLEGEGDLSLEYWRNAHEHFFRLEYEEKGRTFTDKIPVIFEKFEVVYDEERRI
jgi:hypothetical protein